MNSKTTHPGYSYLSIEEFTKYALECSSGAKLNPTLLKMLSASGRLSEFTLQYWCQSGYDSESHLLGIVGSLIKHAIAALHLSGETSPVGLIPGRLPAQSGVCASFSITFAVHKLFSELTRTDGGMGILAHSAVCELLTASQDLLSRHDYDINQAFAFTKRREELQTGDFYVTEVDAEYYDLLPQESY